MDEKKSSKVKGVVKWQAELSQLRKLVNLAMEMQELKLSPKDIVGKAIKEAASIEKKGVTIPKRLKARCLALGVIKA